MKTANIMAQPPAAAAHAALCRHSPCWLRRKSQTPIPPLKRRLPPTVVTHGRRQHPEGGPPRAVPARRGGKAIGGRHSQRYRHGDARRLAQYSGGFAGLRPRHRDQRQAGRHGSERPVAAAGAERRYLGRVCRLSQRRRRRKAGRARNSIAPSFCSTRARWRRKILKSPKTPRPKQRSLSKTRWNRSSVLGADVNHPVINRGHCGAGVRRHHRTERYRRRRRQDAGQFAQSVHHFRPVDMSGFSATSMRTI